MFLRICSAVVTLLLFLAPQARASHLYGADIYYEHITGNRYRINLALYGDCNLGLNAAFSSLANVTPIVHIFNGNLRVDSIALRLTAPGVEVTPVCERELENTSCKSLNGAIPGVKLYIYSAIYTLPQASANWRFRFDGNTPVGVSAGRSVINNLAGSSIMALEATLNNVAGPNSSPRFTTLPTPFYCINVPQQYNHGAVDANNDQLTYSLVPGLFGGGASGLAAGGGPVAYQVPYSGVAPMNGDATGWSFSTTTGQLAFTPTTANKYLIVNEVKELRNGVVVGTSMREMTFIILSTCNNTPSESGLDTNKTNQAGVFVEKERVTICQITDTGRFSIIPNNKSGDTIVASITGLPAGVDDTILNNNTPSPVILLSWIKAALAPGNYNFFVTYKDKGCPLNSQQTKAYTLRVVAPNDLGGPKVLSPTQCYHQAWVEMTPAEGLTPRTITISQGGRVIRSYRDTTGAVIADSLLAGVYTVDIKSDNLDCPTRKNIVVTDSGAYPHVPETEDRFHCLNDPLVPLRVRADTGAVINWYLPDGTRLPSAPVPATDVAGRWLYLLSQQRRVCESAKDSFWLYVTKRPIAQISGEAFQCAFDTGTYVFSGSVGEGPILEYNWTWGNAFYKTGEGPGPWNVVWGDGGEKVLTLQVNENKCPSDTARLSVTVKPRPFSGFDMRVEACERDSVLIQYNTTPLDGQAFSWSFTEANQATASGEGPFRIFWESPGLKRVTLTSNLDGCEDTRYKEITIRELPDVTIDNKTGPVCIGEKIYLLASGADSYSWRPADSMRQDENGMYAQILKPSRYSVVGSNRWACKDSASIDYAIVDGCCKFGYPNAFTPNGDGRNDKFSAVTYGYHKEYQLSIYNRWGQRVFYGDRASEGWDGTFGGKPCDAGTYYYQLSALCFTGHREIQKGDVILIR